MTDLSLIISVMFNLIPTPSVGSFLNVLFLGTVILKEALERAAFSLNVVFCFVCFFHAKKEKGYLTGRTS